MSLMGRKVQEKSMELMDSLKIKIPLKKNKSNKHNEEKVIIISYFLKNVIGINIHYIYIINILFLSIYSLNFSVDQEIK